MENCFYVLVRVIFSTFSVEKLVPAVRERILFCLKGSRYVGFENEKIEKSNTRTDIIPICAQMQNGFCLVLFKCFTGADGKVICGSVFSLLRVLNECQIFVGLDLSLFGQELPLFRTYNGKIYM